MKILNNKNVIQKIIITIVIVLSFNFVIPTFSQADIGGTLLGPVIDLVAGIGDAVMALLQRFMDGSDVGIIINDSMKATDFYDNPVDGMQIDADTSNDKHVSADDIDKTWLGFGTYRVPLISYSPEKIFSNQVPALDANFINPKQGVDKNGNGIIDSNEKWTTEQKEKSIAIKLQSTIASWYNAIRNLVIVGLLTVLLYVGIRMMLTSIASDKAKYKQMLIDWIIALCLVFFMHYIMSFTMTFVDIITTGIGSATSVDVIVTGDPDFSGNLEFKTNLTGYCRFLVQCKDLLTKLIYLIFYIALVVYTFMFTYKYVKRSITLAFLTLIAPLVTLTYPIDKIGDGKAQAFNMWLKEYIFNALLQPFHLIIYTIFLGTSMDIALENPLFAILFLAFITPAEKILRKFFKFDQASTAGASSFAGGFGGAAAYKMISGAVNKLGKGSKDSSAKKGSGIREKKPLENPNAPSGVDGFTAINSSNNAEQDSLDNNNSETNTNRNLQTQPEIDRSIYNADYNDMYLNPEAYQDVVEELQAPEGTIKEQNSDNLSTSQLESKTETTSVSQSTNNEKEGKVDRIKRGIKNKATSVYNDKLANKRWWGQQGIKAAKFAGRTAVRATTGTMLGAIGIGMGIAGDDLDDVFTYGAAGIGLGATTGGNIALNQIGKIGSQVQDIWYGSHEEAQLEQQKRSMRSDEAFIESIQENYQPDGEALHGDELNSAVDRAIEYHSYGITDSKQISKTMKLEDKINKELESQQLDMTEEEKSNLAREKATTVSKLAQKLDDNYLRKPENVKNLRDSLSRSIQASGLSKSDADSNANDMIKKIKQIKKID